MNYRSLLAAAGILTAITMAAIPATASTTPTRTPPPPAPIQHTQQASPPCATGTTCLSGKLQVREYAGDTPGNQLLIEDASGAPMFWVNVGGAQSGGTPVCVMNLQLQPEACLGGPFTPSNDQGGSSAVTLYGPSGSAPLTLTYSDLQQLLTMIGGGS